MSQHHSKVQDQIAETERAIWAGNERLHDLWGELRYSVAQRAKPSKRVMIIGAAVAAMAGVLLFRRRRAVMRGLSHAVHHPMLGGLLQRLPFLGVLLPVFVGRPKGAAQGGAGEQGANKAGVARGGLLGSLLTMAMPWLMGLLQASLAAKRHPREPQQG